MDAHVNPGGIIMECPQSKVRARLPSHPEGTRGMSGVAFKAPNFSDKHGVTRCCWGASCASVGTSKTNQSTCKACARLGRPEYYWDDRNIEGGWTLQAHFFGQNRGASDESQAHYDVEDVSKGW